jgi:hypothetical protein
MLMEIPSSMTELLMLQGHGQSGFVKKVIVKFHTSWTW